jgi:hypothetical protein
MPIVLECWEIILILAACFRKLQTQSKLQLKEVVTV